MSRRYIECISYIFILHIFIYSSNSWESSLSPDVIVQHLGREGMLVTRL